MRAFESRVTELVAEWWRLLEAANASDVSDKQGDRYVEAAGAILARLVELPAADAQDLAAKVLVCAYECRIGEPGPGSYVRPILSSTVVDAERLADPCLVDLAANALCPELGWSRAEISDAEPR